MTELSYNDVTRALNDATRDIRDLMSRVNNQLNRLDSMDAQLTSMRRDVDAIRRDVTTINNITSQHWNARRSNMNQNAVVSSGVDPGMWRQLGSNLHAMDARLIVMQKYLQDVSEYVTLVRAQSIDDDSSRAAR